MNKEDYIFLKIKEESIYKLKKKNNKYIFHYKNAKTIKILKKS